MPKVDTSACAASRTFSCAVNRGNTVVIWNDLTMPRCAKRCCGKPVTSRPSNSILPLDGATAASVTYSLAGIVGSDAVTAKTRIMRFAAKLNV